ncbi:MAG: ABC transporter ATP-binding protein, partial [Deltaproteobacteria bacterium]|nr:ABC transporter ATP-binding protein [Deltaproteobacteria bacterium]
MTMAASADEVTGILQDSRISLITTLRQCVAMLPAGMRWRWAALIPLSLITGTVEAGAAAAVFALIKLIGDPAHINHIPVAAVIAAALPGLAPRTQVLVFTGLVAVYYVIKNLLVISAQYLRHKISGESSAALKSAMFKGYLMSPYPFHLGRNSADLISKINFCVEMVCDQAMEAAISAGSELLTAAAITVVLLIIAPRITLIAGTFLLVMLAVFLRVTRRLADYFGAQRHLLERASLRTQQETLGAIKEIKALGRENLFYSTFSEHQRCMLELGYLGKTLETITPQITETVFVCGALAVVALISRTGPAAAQGPSLLALFGYAAFRIVPAANRIGWQVTLVRSAARPIESLYDDYVLMARNDLVRENADQQNPQFHECIELDHVSYTFVGADTPSVHDINLTIHRGESIGIVGPTGAGKTTLVDLVVGLLEPCSGRILIDGKHLRDQLSVWKHSIGYVPQSIFLLDDSLKRNIALGIDYDEIDEDRVRAAVHLAQLDSFVAGLPHGLDTSVGEHGCHLSGGERQRVGIARALYHEPLLLVFDEATSALDHFTEAAVSGAIEALHGKKTLLVVAHRLSSVRRCDRLIFMSHGRIIGCGSYDLLRAHPE